MEETKPVQPIVFLAVGRERVETELVLRRLIFDVMASRSSTPPPPFPNTGTICDSARLVFAEGGSGGRASEWVLRATKGAHLTGRRRTPHSDNVSPQAARPEGWARSRVPPALRAWKCCAFRRRWSRKETSPAIADLSGCCSAAAGGGRESGWPVTLCFLPGGAEGAVRWAALLGRRVRV